MAADVTLLSTEDAEERFWAAIGSPPEEVDIVTDEELEEGASD